MSGQHAPDPGRRSERSHQAILDAAFALIQEGGYGRLTIEAIAARAGVGKQTIYRWWGSRGGVTLEALVQMAGTAIAFPDTGDVGADLCTQMSAVIRLMADPVIGPAYAGLIADSQFDPVMADVLYGRFIGPRISACAKRLAAGQSRGQVDPAIDLRVTAELLFGAIYHRLLLHSGPLTTDYVGAVVDMVMRGLAARRPGGGSAQHGGTEEDPPSAAAAASPGPRSRDAILHAAYELCGGQGFGALTIEAVAARAKVGKQTIYRWWPSKGAVVLDALLGVLQGDVTYPDSGDIAADLRARLRTLVPLYTSSDFGPIYRGLIAESQFDARLAEDLYGRLVGPRMAACRRRLARAQEQGQVADSLDRQCITELLYGAVHHRLLLHGRPLTAGYVNAITKMAMSGAQQRRRRAARSRRC